MARLGIAGAGSSMGTNAVDVPKNIIDQQEELKSWPDDRLIQELQSPSGSAPQYLIFTEVGRRKDVRGKYQAEMAKQQQPQMSMAQEAVMARMAPPMQPPMPPPGGPISPLPLTPKFRSGPSPGGSMPPMGPGGPMGPPPGGPMGPPPGVPMPPMTPGGIAGMAGGGPVRGFANGDLLLPGESWITDEEKRRRGINLEPWSRFPYGIPGDLRSVVEDLDGPAIEQIRRRSGEFPREVSGIIRDTGEFIRDADEFPGIIQGTFGRKNMATWPSRIGGFVMDQYRQLQGLGTDPIDESLTSGIQGELNPEMVIPETYEIPPVDETYGIPPVDETYGKPPVDETYGKPPVAAEPPSDIARIRELLESRENPGNESWKTAAMLKAAQAFLSNPTFAGAAGEAFGGTAGVIEDMEKRDESRRLANIQNQIALAGLEQTERESALERDAKRDIAKLNNDARRLLYAENNDARLEQIEKQIDMTLRSEERQQVAKAVADFFEDNKDVYDGLAMMEDGLEKQQQEALLASRYRQLISGVKSALSPRSVGMKRGMKHGGVVRGVLGRP
jgi:hypothetical protein